MKLQILGTNSLLKEWQDKTFAIESLFTNEIGCHIIKLVDQKEEIYFNKPSEVKFLNDKILLEGYVQIGHNIGSISVLVYLNENNAIL